MGLRATNLKEKNQNVSVSFDGATVAVTYRIGAISPHWFEGLGSTSVRDMLAPILVHWDVLDDADQPLVPLPKSDPSYTEAVIAQREKLELTQRALEAKDDSVDIALSTKDKAEIAKRPVTEFEYAEAYTAAWRVLMADLPQAFLAVLLDAIMEDVRPGPKRK